MIENYSKLEEVARYVHLGSLPPATSFFTLNLKNSCFALSMSLASFFLMVSILAIIQKENLGINATLFWISIVYTFSCVVFFTLVSVVIYFDKSTCTIKTLKKEVIYWSAWVVFGLVCTWAVYIVVSGVAYCKLVLSGVNLFTLLSKVPHL